ncbi:Stp1/IreP family PP2C-type Ser/Thr phosphatase [Synechococcus sp. PCC 6312]|uniref:Stp1/IreP family PP2C-type Ser/Thr phosphatase n=1 Tax=Synechococcus sp. (strain ATCC 27167 / PCC 6312) TaxID=195253 RepID=UPI00029EE187|nr:Stp1/IreP family PP2C-type Ser/Thr phosphatase [Synechococcus sp. PCC 6312]AFY61533.1 serine/threonine protein phosphatase [Synechococcus sp. PCC 6312]
MKFIGLTDTGLVRKNNQDSFWLDDPQGRFFIVADGMGGYIGGEVASQLAVEKISQHLEKNLAHQPFDPVQTLKDAFFAANQAILAEQLNQAEQSDMGTTAVVLLLDGERAWCAHVGDSRIYHWRDNKLAQVTEDHTWIAQAVRLGTLSLEQARHHPWRHVLSQCLGREDLMTVDIEPIQVQAGDRFLLCSDGLTEELTEELLEIYVSDPNQAEAAKNLVDAAKDSGGRDNITVVLVTL